MSKSDTIKAGYIQFEPILGDISRNMKTIAMMLEKTKTADLVVLPELANTGYNFESKEQALYLAENVKKSIYIDFLITQAKKYNQYIVSGFTEFDSDKLFNSAVIVGTDGLIGKYRKLHLFMNEKNYFEKGDLGLPIFKTDMFTVGILICFDWIFPECWRILALKRAEIICHPSNLVLPYAQQAVPVHGLVNRTFNITANRIGTERNITFTGQSIISDPDGKILFKAAKDKEDVAIAEIDLTLARNKMITPHNHIFTDRFPAEYTLLCE